jgi:hypothetical protein
MPGTNPSANRNSTSTSPAPTWPRQTPEPSSALAFPRGNRKTKKGATRDRWLRVLKDEAFDLIRDLAPARNPEHLLKVMEVGTVSTNVFLRRVHNFALDMGWLLAVDPEEALAQDHLPEKRAITPGAPGDPGPRTESRRKAFYQLAGCSAHRNRTWPF